MFTRLDDVTSTRLHSTNKLFNTQVPIQQNPESHESHGCFPICHVAVLRSVQLLIVSGIHLNAQNVIMPFLVEEVRVTDLGTNALLQTSAGGLVSVRANFTASQMLSSGLELR
jgi:hypothetical protein